MRHIEAERIRLPAQFVNDDINKYIAAEMLRDSTLARFKDDMKVHAMDIFSKKADAS